MVYGLWFYGFIILWFSEFVDFVFMVLGLYAFRFSEFRFYEFRVHSFMV